ncbi:MAG: FeoB-associated Cys-rich membrane protein [Planctomycetaceae bacterium]|nr:FeoB-associated Cys-rich membrane protein [Planctomycetaceae bacterium]
MSSFLENLVIVLIVGGAVFALGRRFYRFLSQVGQGGAACGSGCGDCGSKVENAPSPKPLVQLDLNGEKHR